MTTSNDKAARYKLSRLSQCLFQCVRRAITDVGITHSHVLFIWIRHLASWSQADHIQPHAACPRKAHFGDILRLPSGKLDDFGALVAAYRDTLKALWVPWTSWNEYCDVFNFPGIVQLWFMRQFHESTCSFLLSTFPAPPSKEVNSRCHKTHSLELKIENLLL